MKIIRLAARLLGYAFYPIMKSPAFFVFMFVLGYVCNRLETPKFSELGVFELFVDLYAVCLVLSFISWRVRRPSSRIWRRTLKTSGWAFSTSSKRTTE